MIEALQHGLFVKPKKIYNPVDFFNEHKFESQASSLLSSAMEKNFSKILDYWTTLSTTPYWDAMSPVRENTKTRARQSFQIGNINYILFSDQNELHFWILAQSVSAINAIIWEDGIVTYGEGSETIIKNMRELQHIKVALKDFDQSFFDGFLVSQTRPFHFFYDVLKWLWVINERRQSIADCSIKSLQLFFRPGRYFFPLDFIINSTSYNVSAQAIVALPTTISRNSIFNSTSKKPFTFESESSESKHITIAFETAIRDYSIKQKNFTSPPSKNDHQKTIWLGVSSEKRQLKNTTSIYAKFIDSVCQHQPDEKFLFIIDGITAPVNFSVDTHMDDDIVNSLIMLVKSKNAVLKSIIGWEYPAKIQICQHIDFFIVNGGTGGFVPLRLAHCPGIIHTSPYLFSFFDDYPNIKIVYGKSTESDEPKLHMRSYEIDSDDFYLF